MPKHNQVKKQDWQTNAELKTYSDYAVMLEYKDNMTPSAARGKTLDVSHDPDNLFKELLRRNIELFQTGSIIMQ